MFRFLHTSDLHLGRPFGRFPEDVRGRLRQARFDALGRLVTAARMHGAGVILLAGDTFDAETPTPALIRQALNVMSGASDLMWVLMPGNHDSLAASELWRTLAAGCPGNVMLAVEPTVIELADRVVLLPAPCTSRRPGRDQTEWMDQPTEAGTIRIGLAHGGITGFGSGGTTSSEEGNAAIIPPDRAARSGLDYLALGDWHGTLRVGPATWYSGTPENDSFKHGPAGALLVVAAGPGHPVEVVPVPTGGLRWCNAPLDVLPGDDAVARLAADLPPVADRMHTLLQVAARGRLGLAARNALEVAIGRVRPDFLWLAEDLSELTVEQVAADLDMIDRAGALRTAAERLQAEATDNGLTQADRDIAAAALSRLFSFSSETV